MKSRTAEAARLEADYLARVRGALADREPSEIDEVMESINAHIEEELSESPGDETTLVQMANVLEQLGPPEAYAQDSDTVPAPTPATAPTPTPRRSGSLKAIIYFGIIWVVAVLTWLLYPPLASWFSGPHPTR